MPANRSQFVSSFESKTPAGGDPCRSGGGGSEDCMAEREFIPRHIHTHTRERARARAPHLAVTQTAGQTASDRPARPFPGPGGLAAGAARRRAGAAACASIAAQAEDGVPAHDPQRRAQDHHLRWRVRAGDTVPPHTHTHTHRAGDTATRRSKG